MRQTKNELISYRIGRSEECLEEARILAGTGHWNVVVNRLYYACFYISGALFVMKDIELDCKNEFYQEFNHKFIETGNLDAGLGAIFLELYEKKEEEDKAQIRKYEPSEITVLIANAEFFVNTIFAEISKKD
jgi:uncharacterized protein (UPF0332 family)